jgi:glycosyltransferase involved in cell wall biosynthesis
MKILMTTDNIGGVWTFATDMASGMKKHGIEVYLAITGNPLTEDQQQRLRNIPYYFEEFRQEWMDDPWHDIELTGQWLLDIKEEIEPDLIHLNAYSLGSINWDVPVIMTLHSCVLTWWEAVRKEKIPSCWNTYREMIASGIRAADMITAPSYAMLQSSEKKYGSYADKKVIYNGRDPGHFHAGEVEKIVFSMGRLWDDAKNIRLILEAAPRIRYPIFIAGNNGKQGSPGNIPDNVHLLGQLSPASIADWLARSAIYLLPVLYEPFGYTFLEAAFSKCALVGGDIPTLREIWEKSMIYASNSSAESLANRVNELMEDKEQREKISEEAYHRAIEKYHLDLMLENYAQLYARVLDQSLNSIQHQTHEHEN